MHVAKLALMLFDELESRVGAYRPGVFRPHLRELLHVGALLHDVGYLVNYAKHHKHSYHLIVHSGMRGFSQRELEVVANIARYHRRSGPKPKHSAYMRLPEPDREAVRVLSAILRIADGLDRAHSQRVTGVSIEIIKNKAIFTIQSEMEPAVNQWGAQRKSDLFADVFDLEPVFVWADQKETDQ